MSFRCVQPLALLLLLLSPAACRKPHSAPTEHSFYYWKTEGAQSTPAEDSLLRRLDVAHFYLHFMDVDWSENLKMPVPRFRAYDLERFALGRYTPVVFISNRVFERMSEAWCDSLALRLETRLREFAAETDRDAVTRQTYGAQGLAIASLDSLRDRFRKKQQQAWSEVQIDCDWTAATRARYFHFLRRFKARFADKQVSVTVRLYPYKYPGKMGVPPVDRGLLMCYNMDDIRRPATENSVFDLQTLRSYLDAQKYPLPLDAALPLFGWSAVFRGPQYKGLLYRADSLLTGHREAFERMDENHYRLLRDTVLETMYLRAGDVLRTERPDAAALLQAAKLLRKELPGLRRLAFYHWNYEDVARYEQTIADSWSRP